MGLLALPLFAARFLVQWIKSEKEGRCVTPRSFWLLSTLAHTLMLLHAFIQLQFHVATSQLTSLMIVLRNLQLQNKNHCSTLRFCVYLAAALTALTAVFACQLHLSHISGWFNSPSLPWLQQKTQWPFAWHLFGTLGLLLFSFRFLLQWWYAERYGRSELPYSFWVMSNLGNLILLIYFGVMSDLVNLLGPLFALIPYWRNLILSKRVA